MNPPTVFVAGAFDGLHVGHQWLLSVAAQLGAVRCIVGRDVTIFRLKGEAPKVEESDRLERVKGELAAYGSAHTARLGNASGDRMSTLKQINPDRVLLGYDQRFTEEEIIKALPNVQVVRASAYAPEYFKSSYFR